VSDTGGAAAGSPPSDVDGRVRAHLADLGIDYEVMPCDPALADTAAFCGHYGVPPESSGNVIVVASKDEPRRHAACLVLATTRLDVNQTVRRLLGVKRLSFASSEETEDLTGMAVGGVTLFGLPADWPIYVDSRVMALEQVVLGGGSRSWKMKIAPAALRRMPQVQVIEGLGLVRA
jgi:prolyl-tRNA editing enzyme YbaK/EbsC (Cys-tRNA(Pro) deacylase)